MKRRKCANKICNNLSRRFEDRFCCIECADYHDKVIDYKTYLHLISYYQYITPDDWSTTQNEP